MNLRRYVLILCLSLVSMGALAEGKVSPIVVDGNDWMSSSGDERRAFLIGVANMLIAEAAYAKREGSSAPPVGTRIAAAVSELKLPEIEARITTWYEANPSARSEPVMGVIWKSFVKGGR